MDGFIQKAEKLEIQAYKKPKDLKSIKKTHVAFSGSPLKHPFNPKKVILVADPFSTNTFYPKNGSRLKMVHFCHEI